MRTQEEEFIKYLRLTPWNTANTSNQELTPEITKAMVTKIQ